MRIEHDEHSLGVPRGATAYFAIRRIRRVSRRVANRGRVDTGHLPELPLGTPEAPERKHRALETGRERRFERRAIHVMRRRNGHLLGAAGQRVFLRRWFEFAAKHGFLRSLGKTLAINPPDSTLKAGSWKLSL